MNKYEASNNKNAALSKFVTLTHELSLDMRTPLNSISGHSELILNDKSGTHSDLQQDYIETIHNSSKHVLALNYDLVDVAKLIIGKMQLDFQVVNLETIIHEVMAAFERPDVDNSLSFRLEPMPDIHAIQADPIRIKQILVILISFISPNSSKIEIHLQIIQENASPMAQLGITCHDWNILELDKDTEDIWSESSLTLLNADHYGLFIAKSLVNLHGGRMWTERDAETTNTIQLTFPVADD